MAMLDVHRVLGLLSVLALVLNSVGGCGYATHIEIGERTSEYFNAVSEGVDYHQLIQRHPDAFQAGCPYPDAYYPSLCFDGIYHSVSEDTHWTPFLNATVNYIRSTYPRPWTIHAEKLVVFLLGVVTHQVADVNWHSLGIDQGFLRTMGKVNFHGSFGEAHSIGDFGGDVLNVFELNMDYVGLVNKWWVPTQDLLNIYTELYGQPDKLNATVVEDCTNWLFLGRLGENIGVIEMLYPYYSGASTFLLDRLNDYYLGGMDDMATWSGNTWTNTVTMLDQGTQACTLPTNPIYIECNVVEDYTLRRKRSANEVLKNPGVRSETSNLVSSLFDKDDVIIKRSNGASILEPTKQAQKRLHEARANLHPTAAVDDINATLPNALYITRQSYSRLGESMLAADVNADGHADLIIAAPLYWSPGNYQQGRVYIIYGDENGIPMQNLTVEDSASVILEGTQKNGRFGHALAVADLNHDGLNDLAISAPSVGSDQLNYYGEVYVYYGQPSGGISTTADLTLTCTERYCNLGWSLTSGDLDLDGIDDLIVGAPFAPSGGEQRGFVGVLYKKQSASQLTELDFNWRWNGEQNYEWLGFSVAAQKTSASEGWLAVGAPTYRICAIPDCSYDSADVQAVGKVYMFDAPLPDTPSSVHVGKQSFGQLGATLSGIAQSGQNFLAVAATSYTDEEGNFTQIGAVELYQNANMSRSPFVTFTGDREFGRFGSHVQMYAGSEGFVIAIAASFRSETMYIDQEGGRVYLYNGGGVGRVISTEQADTVLGINEPKSRFGSSIVTVPTLSGKVQLVASAPHSNAGARLAGSVAIFDL